MITEWNRPFFSAAQSGRLVLQRCDDCHKLVYYPRPACPGCLGDQLSWEEIDRGGTLYSFSVVWRPQHASFEPHVPIVMAAVELDAGVMMIANLVHSDPDEVLIGDRVEVMFSAYDGGPVLPRFRAAPKEPRG
jgi:uncharacterized OB-fold protein